MQFFAYRIFQQVPDLRNPELERTLCSSLDGVLNYHDWCWIDNFFITFTFTISIDV